MNLQWKYKTNVTDSTTEHSHSKFVKKTDGDADTQYSPSTYREDTMVNTQYQTF